MPCSAQPFHQNAVKTTVNSYPCVCYHHIITHILWFAHSKYDTYRATTPDKESTSTRLLKRVAHLLEARHRFTSISTMSLSRALASRGSLLRSGVCASSSASVARELGLPAGGTGGRLSSSMALSGARAMARVGVAPRGGMRGLGRRGKALVAAGERGERLLQQPRRQPSRSIGWFSSGPSTSTLRALEQETLHAPGDANIEVRRRIVCIVEGESVFSKHRQMWHWV